MSESTESTTDETTTATVSQTTTDGTTSTQATTITTAEATTIAVSIQLLQHFIAKKKNWSEFDKRQFQKF